MDDLLAGNKKAEGLENPSASRNGWTRLDLVQGAAAQRADAGHEARAEQRDGAGLRNRLRNRPRVVRERREVVHVHVGAGDALLAAVPGNLVIEVEVQLILG